MKNIYALIVVALCLPASVLAQDSQNGDAPKATPPHEVVGQPVPPVKKPSPVAVDKSKTAKGGTKQRTLAKTGAAGKHVRRDGGPIHGGPVSGGGHHGVPPTAVHPTAKH